MAFAGLFDFCHLYQGRTESANHKATAASTAINHFQSITFRLPSAGKASIVNQSWPVDIRAQPATPHASTQDHQPQDHQPQDQH